jgi:hypothetical protein
MAMDLYACQYITTHTIGFTDTNILSNINIFLDGEPGHVRS